MADPRSSNIRVPPPTTQRSYSSAPVANDSGQVRDVSAYASDLATWNSSSKHSFLFVTEIELNPDYAGIADMTRFALLTQTASRPKIKFEHQEYNEYGIRKGALVKTTFTPIDLTFVDDNANSVMQFFSNVLKLMSPITNIDDSSLVDNRQYDFKTGLGSLTKINASASGINIQERNTGDFRPNLYAQSSGSPGDTITHMKATGTAATSLFKTVRVHHVHLFGAGVNTFSFKNPRLTAMDFDDLTMTDSGDTTSMLKVQFAYDYLTTASSQMTAEISRLVGSVNYYLRRDLSSDSGGPVNQQQQTYVEPSLAQNTSQSSLTTAQIDSITTQIAAAQAQAAQATSAAEQATYDATAAGLRSALG